MHKGTLCRSFFAVILLFGLFADAGAVPMLRLEATGPSGSAAVTVGDGGGLDLSPSGDGAVLFFGALQDWTFNVTTGMSKPGLGSAVQPYLDLNSFNVTSRNVAGTINLLLTDTGFGPLSSAASVLAEIGGTSSGSLTYRTFYDPTNTPFGQAVELTSGSFGAGAFSGTTSGSLPAAGLYSLTLLVTIFHDGSNASQATSFDASLRVPEPSSLLLVGAGLLLLGFAVRRRIGGPARAAGRR